MDIEKIVQQFRDERSQEMYGKPEIQLTIAERMKLDEYIKDYLNPTWKDVIIDGVSTDFVISNTGVIKRISDGKINKPWMNDCGYHNVRILMNNGQARPFKLHRLVAQAFIPNPENKREVNHINCIKTFNWVGNLEWVTSAENKKHAREHGLYANILKGTKKSNSVYTDEEIHRVCKLLSEGKHVKEAAKLAGVPESCVRSVKYLGKWKHIASLYDIPKVGDIPRHVPNTPSHSAKLSESDVHEICKMLVNGSSYKDIASRWNISKATIASIRNGRAWNYIAKTMKMIENFEIEKKTIINNSQ